MFEYLKTVFGDRAVEWLAFWQRDHDKTQRGEHTAARVAGTNFSVLVAQLEGDTDGAQTRHLAESLETLFGYGGSRPAIKIHRYPKALIVAQPDVSGAVAKAESKGRSWLQRKNADVLIWGSVAGNGSKTMRLRFLPLSETVANDAKRFALNEVFELPASFGEDVGAALAIAVTASIAPLFEHPGHVLTGIIEPAVKKLVVLAPNMPAGFSTEAKASIWHAYAAGEQQLGEDRGETARLEMAAFYYRKALGEWTRQRNTQAWTSTQNNLGEALRVLGERAGDAQRLEAAAAAFREALKEWTRDRAPLAWAGLQNNLGKALSNLGEREAGTARLEEAAAAFREALKEATRAGDPLLWGHIHSNLGGALRTIGMRENGTASLNAAIAAYREALGELTRERAPLAWAGIHNNIGITFHALGERERNPEALTQAANAFREALGVFSLESTAQQWAQTQNNLGDALRALAEHDTGTQHLVDAIAACGEALKVWTRETAPRQWATAKNSLGNALGRLGEREEGTARLVEAARAFRDVVKVWTRDAEPIRWATARNNLGTTLWKLGERQAAEDLDQACATLKEARVAFLDALQEFIRRGIGAQEDAARGNIGQLAKLMARVGCTN